MTAPTSARIQWFKYVRAPLFFVNLLIGGILTFSILASVSIGAWIEDALRFTGYEAKRSWLPAIIGILLYLAVGLIGPIVLGNYLIGWPGAVITPVIIGLVIVYLGRW
jgi:hypothetical protein